MWTVSQIICLGSLAGLSVTDIYYRKVPGEILAMGAAGTFIYQLCCRSISLWILAGGIGVGVYSFWPAGLRGKESAMETVRQF